MSMFDELESAAFDTIIAGDYEPARLFRYDANPENDGFNSDYKTELSYLRNVTIAMSNSGTSWIGTTRDTDIKQNDVIEITNARGLARRYTVVGFEPSNRHTMLTLEEVKTNGKI